MSNVSELDTKYQNEIESRRLWHRLNERFVKAMATYHLIEDDDKILVGLSGGKDSLLLLELLAKRSRIDHPRFKVEALHVRMENIHYETDTSYLQAFCDNLGVKLHVLTTSFEVINEEAASNEISNLKPQSSKLKTQNSNLKTQKKAENTLFPLLMEPSKADVQSGAGAGMQQDSPRSSSGRYSAHGTYEPNLPRTVRHHACTAQNAQDATLHHPSAMHD